VHKLTSDDTPLHQSDRLNELGPSILQRRAPTILAFQAELMFRREFGHIWWPLALGFVRARIGLIVGGRVVIVIMFVSGKAEGRGGLLDGECKMRCGCG